jgi:TatD DNase family protein
MVDSHCHLAGEEFAGDLREVVSRAREAGLTTVLCILAAGNAAESARAVAVRDAWPEAQFAAGIHPHQALEYSNAGRAPVELVRATVALEGACAVGEIGLDYHYDFSPRELQQEIFAGQVALARELRLPVVIHTREATDDTFRILQEAGEGEVRGVFHCFTGDEPMARAALDLGFHISFAGIVTFPKAGTLRDVARMVPADRLLAETDSPYLAPVPHRGTRNEPAHVAHVIATLAEVRGTPAAEIAVQVARNFETLFGRRAPANGME